MDANRTTAVSKHFGAVVVGSSLGKLASLADRLEAKGFSIEVTGPDSFTGFQEGVFVVEADVSMSLVPQSEFFTWEEYFIE